MTSRKYISKIFSDLILRVIRENPFPVLSALTSRGSLITLLGSENMQARIQFTPATNLNGAVSSKLVVNRVSDGAVITVLEAALPMTDPTLFQFLAPTNAIINATHTQFDLNGVESLPESLPNLFTSESFAALRPVGSGLSIVGYVE